MSKTDFKVYLDLIFEPYNRFTNAKEHVNRKQNNECNVVVTTNLEAKGRECKGKGLSLVSKRFHLFILMEILHLRKDQHSKKLDLPLNETDIFVLVLVQVS